VPQSAKLPQPQAKDLGVNVVRGKYGLCGLFAVQSFSLFPEKELWVIQVINHPDHPDHPTAIFKSISVSDSMYGHTWSCISLNKLNSCWLCSSAAV